ncbi:DVU_1555 family C-GCAxxG-C-C protein [Geotalea sp. SG265]|uniref:DVU_1555 family C-GCAxxG-C-C protein n=1 Tax=Geotalea sp. SG265 TaxID=2922867 RepID=UPI001FAEA164|nr:DV_1555 family C-GCAxxG-C-C protein [Geotalea sp. SG265]
MNEIFLDLLRLKTRGYCCSQIMVVLALEAQGKSNPDLVRSMGGLCFGINWSGETCGALLGGAAILGLYGGKGRDEEVPDSDYPLMMTELVDWFGETADMAYGGRRCSEILEKSPDHSMCARIVVDIYGKCREILMRSGFDPALGRKG